MAKFSIAQSSGNTFVLNYLSDDEQINQFEINLLSSKRINELIPVNFSKSDLTKERLLQWCITGRASLSFLLSSMVVKKVFLDIVSQIINVLKICEANGLYSNNLLLNTDYIFVDNRSKTLSFVYLPIQNFRGTTDIKLFFKSLVFRTVFNKSENADYVKSYLNFLNDKNEFALFKFEEFILKLQGVVQSNISNSKPVASLEPQSKICGKCGKANLTSVKYCVGCGNILTAFEDTVRQVGYVPVPMPAQKNVAEKLQGGQPSIPLQFQNSKPFGKPTTQEFTETTVLGEDSAGETTVLSAEELNSIYPVLVRKKTGEKIVINKPVFRIGKEKSYVDYFVSDNGAVSRSHADIITKSGKYYIQDRNSTNKTYIEGKVIPPDKEIEIFDGQYIRLANEEFEFIRK